MSKDLLISSGDKAEKYKTLIIQLSSLLKGDEDIISKMANTAAAIKQTFDFLWVGFYRVKKQELILSPFQGTIACSKIPYGKGVCGTAWKEKQTIIVPDVSKFAGHISCSSDSQSEIVIPIFKNNEVTAVLDIDSDKTNDFDETDAKGLEEIIKLL
jgi:GAF domain-containing protein